MFEKKSVTKKSGFLKGYLPTSWLFFPKKKKKKKIFFFPGPKILKKPAKNLPSDQRITTSQAFLNISTKNKISLLETSRSQKTNFSRALTKRLTAILRPFLESSRSQKKIFLEP